ncbi:MAG: cellulase family glycosylhydrolase [Patescibacteria group bacterium]|nr:cellulase family glycosylhydrolase [Patescibacteria group bacterium]
MYKMVAALALTLALAGCQKAGLPVGPGTGSFGCAMSGVMEGSPWIADYSASLTSLRGTGCSVVSIPVDQSSDLSKLPAVLLKAHQLGFSIHVAPHNDAGGADTANWPEVDFAGYANWFDKLCQECVNTDGTTYVNSVELWNEAEYNVAGDYWTPATTLYNNAPALCASVRHYLPTAQIIMPVPLDQSLEKAMDMQGYSTIVNDIKAMKPTAMSIHAYPTSNPENGVVSLDGRLAYASGLSTFIGLPVVFTEYGMGSSGSPVGDFYKGCAGWLRLHNTWGIAWQWYDVNGSDGLQLQGQTTILSNMNTFVYTSAFGQGLNTQQ